METPRLLGYAAYLIAVVALLAAIWRQVAHADRAEAELDRRNNRSP